MVSGTVFLKRVTRIITPLTICLVCQLFISSTLEAGELFRLRVENMAGGLVQASCDSGTTYHCLGRVTTPANARITGFAAASYSRNSTVAATAVHGIRLRTGSKATGVGKAQQALIFSITPKQFVRIPSGYGGHIARSSGIITDIESGQSIFRFFAPFAGNDVYLEKMHSLEPLPEDYIPSVTDTIVIIVEKPAEVFSQIVFENKKGGSVTAIGPGGAKTALAKVVRPVMGVGRYDGTTYTGVGAINTNHAGVLTISTAPVRASSFVEGGRVESRGGFMVQPVYHADEQGETKPQVMVIAKSEKVAPELEGTPPVFKGNIGLAWDASAPENSYRVEVDLGDGKWQNPPEMTGRIDDAFTKESLTSYLEKRGEETKDVKGLTRFRVMLPDLGNDFYKAKLKEISGPVNSRYEDSLPNVCGKVYIGPSKADGVALAVFHLDGNFLAKTSKAPFEVAWDTANVHDGVHSLAVYTRKQGETTYVKSVHQIYVANKKAPGLAGGQKRLVF